MGNWTFEHSKKIWFLASSTQCQFADAIRNFVWTCRVHLKEVYKWYTSCHLIDLIHKKISYLQLPTTILTLHTTRITEILIPGIIFLDVPLDYLWLQVFIHTSAFPPSKILVVLRSCLDPPVFKKSSFKNWKASKHVSLFSHTKKHVSLLPSFL